MRATGLSFTYPGAAHAALSPTTFTWRAGRLLVVCGPNGSGKTTLLRLLLKLATPSAGQLRVDDASLATIADRSWRGSIAYVAQVPYVDEDATVRDFVRLLAPDATDAALHDALLRVELFERLAHDHPRDPLATRMRTLSAGQTQRVVLARAFVQKAKIVVFDEPDASLDAAGVTLLVSLLRSLAEERLVAVVAHSPMILAAADDVVTLAIADAPSSL